MPYLFVAARQLYCGIQSKARGMSGPGMICGYIGNTLLTHTIPFQGFYRNFQGWRFILVRYQRCNCFHQLHMANSADRYPMMRLHSL